MRRWNRLVPAVLLPAVAALGWAAGANAAPLAVLYRGQPAQEANLVLGGWGSGTAKESKAESLNGSGSILVTTSGYYSGGRIDFTQPVDLGRYANMAGASLRFDLNFPSASSATDANGYPVPGGGFFQGPPMPGGPPLPGGPPMPGGVPYTGTGTQEGALQLATHNLRVVLFSGATQYAAVDQAVDPEAVDNGWIRVVVPLAAFRGAGNSPANWENFRLNRMLIFGDAKDSFYIGNISLVQTDLSITDVSAGEDQEVFAGDVADFTGSATGSAGLKFSWDFDSSDGIQEDAVGRHVTYRYRKAGTYTVTLTVSDPNGVMRPVTKTTVVKVND